MARNRDPFALALATLRERAAAGAFHPERPIVIRDEARRLGLSPTPVREALAWLGGEGLVQRAASSGYLGARLDAGRLKSRYAFRLQCVRLALEAAGPPPAPDGGAPAPSEAPQATFRRIIQCSGDESLEAAFERVSLQLVMVRGPEARLLGDPDPQAREIAESLRRGDAPSLLRAVETYHRRRIELAAALLVELAGRHGDAPGPRSGPPERSP